MLFDPLNDNISSLELIDNMGSDLSVVNAARVSMAKQSDYEWDTLGSGDRPSLVLGVADQKLIKYLAKHKHWTPFSHPQVQLRIKMPIFIARQWFKHMIGFTRNEVSRRYVNDEPQIYVPTELRLKADNVKQGSSNDVYPYVTFEVQGTSRSVRSAMNEAVRLYNAMIEKGICPEQARMVLPQSMYTEFIETGSLAAYARLAGLRLDPHAQKEVRLYAEAINNLMAQLYPHSWAALMEAQCPSK